MGVSLRWRISMVGRQRAARGDVAPAGAKDWLRGEHVPDRLGEPAGYVDLGDLGAALVTEAPLGGLVAAAIDGMPAALLRGLDQRVGRVNPIGHRSGGSSLARKPPAEL